MSSRSSVLIISPHVDDDVIGCGALLRQRGHETTTFYCGVDEFHEVDAMGRFGEAAAVAHHCGLNRMYWPYRTHPGDAPRMPFEVATELRPYQSAREVNRYDFESLKNDFEWLIREEEPETVLLPWPSYNQDHQTVYRAAMVALRPQDRNHFVRRVLLYEEPDCWWPGMGDAFRPNHYRRLSIEEKIGLYSLMPSQVRGHRSPEHIEALARVRGGAIGVEFAEAYHVLRWIE